MPTETKSGPVYAESLSLTKVFITEQTGIRRAEKRWQQVFPPMLTIPPRGISHAVVCLQNHVREANWTFNLSM